MIKTNNKKEIEQKELSEIRVKDKVRLGSKKQKENVDVIEDKKYEEDAWKFLRDPIKKTNIGMVGGLIDQIIMVKDLLLVIWVFAFVESPYVQLIPSIAIFSASIFLLIKYKPYISKTFYLTIVVNEIVYLFVLLFYLIFLIFRNNMDFESRRKYVGYTLIFVVALAILFNIGVALFETIQAVRRYCKKKQEEKKMKQEEDLRLSKTAKRAKGES